MPPKRRIKDTTSPTGAPGSRARSARTLKPPPATDSDDSEVPPTRPAKRTRRAASRATRRKQESDDEFGDYGRGRSSSKPATIEQHLMDQNQKSKEFIQSFKEQVAEGLELVQETLAKLKQDLITPNSPVNDNLYDIYTALQTTAQTISARDSHPLSEHTQHLLRLSRAILKCHETAVRGSRAPDLASPRETWKQDEEGMRKLLEYGKLFGERVVEGWITPSSTGGGTEGDNSNGEEDEEAERRSEAENLARGLFEWRRKGRELQESWGVAARRQMVALAGVVRTLPSKGEE